MKYVLLCLLLSCSRDPRPEIDLTREHDSAITYQGVSFTTVFELQANETAPLVVMLHGLGDTARHFREAWPAVPVKIQLSFPLAPLPYNGGRQWFEWPPGTGDEAFADAVTAAATKLWPAIAELARGRKVMIGGFSQGAVVAYAIAAAHPDEVSAAFLIGGRIPRKLVTGKTPPIAALHGTADRRISIDDAREGIASLKAAGANATLYEYPDVGHTITPAMFEQLTQLIRAQL
jgi:phospholipase/carboxylesterase